MNYLLKKLQTAYKDVGNGWVFKNFYPLNIARMYDVMICGSIGATIANGKSDKLPNDMDFVATNIDSALSFADALHKQMALYKIYYKVMYNSKTSFCPDGCIYHIRIHSPMWLPICIFVVPDATYWTYLSRWLIQKPKEIQTAANDISERDGIERKYIDNNIFLDKDFGDNYIELDDQLKRYNVDIDDIQF